MSDIRILLVDDHQLVRVGMRTLLSALPGIAVVGDTGDGPVSVQDFRQVRRDVEQLRCRRDVG